ncbi:O-methyltransferase [Corynebacterium lowii]|uniref:Putative O-methyltransferase n=1 Tax=Corynebacterium lowii TaxID=1544413 RepID=A0A0Q1AI69_9CORY|nr:methyltransferase [Corynebacterium lowii]KQB86310.1 putative O-methyltransferase [Corynebacterium lowii]MDP9850795.1 putative O-methyltransferase YrrM [Corynebacterium lowii]
MTETAFDSLRDYINSLPATQEEGPQASVDKAIAAARRDAEEYGLTAPDHLTGMVLSALTAASSSTKSAGAIALTPALAVVGLYLLRGMPQQGTVTCIDPEAEHQRQAKEAFRAAGFAPSRGRFLPSRPLDVLSRMAPESYQLVYAEVEPVELRAVIDATWPLLVPGGTLVLADALLDATVADTSRKDQATAAARAAQEHLLTFGEKAVISHLPFGAGTTLVTRLS